MELDEVTIIGGANHISQMGIDLISHFEGMRLEAYQDSVGIWTISIGCTFYEDGSKVKKGDKITQERAIQLFRNIIKKFEQMVLNKVKRPLSQHEFDAAVSFAYNAGTSYKSSGGWKDFSLWSNIQNKMPLAEIKPYWESLATTGGGKVLNGLVRRRKAEAWLYCNGELKFFE